MRETAALFLLLVALLIVVGCMGWYLLDQKYACEARGGALVRGVIGFACVRGAP